MTGGGGGVGQVVVVVAPMAGTWQATTMGMDPAARIPATMTTATMDTGQIIERALAAPGWPRRLPHRDGRQQRQRQPRYLVAANHLDNNHPSPTTRPGGRRRPASPGHRMPPAAGAVAMEDVDACRARDPTTTSPHNPVHRDGRAPTAPHPKPMTAWPRWTVHVQHPVKVVTPTVTDNGGSEPRPRPTATGHMYPARERERERSSSGASGSQRGLGDVLVSPKQPPNTAAMSPCSQHKPVAPNGRWRPARPRSWRPRRLQFADVAVRWRAYQLTTWQWPCPY